MICVVTLQECGLIPPCRISTPENTISTSSKRDTRKRLKNVLRATGEQKGKLPRLLEWFIVLFHFQVKKSLIALPKSFAPPLKSFLLTSISAPKSGPAPVSSPKLNVFSLFVKFPIPVSSEFSVLPGSGNSAPFSMLKVSLVPPLVSFPVIGVSIETPAFRS